MSGQCLEVIVPVEKLDRRHLSFEERRPGGGAVAPGHTAYGMEVVRDAGLLLLALWLIWQPRSRLTLDPRT